MPDTNPQIEKLRQAIATLEAQQRDFGLDHPAQIARLQSRLNVLIQGATIGGDVIGRDKITAGGSVIIAKDGSTIVISEQPIAMTAVDRE